MHKNDIFPDSDDFKKESDASVEDVSPSDPKPLNTPDDFVDTFFEPNDPYFGSADYDIPSHMPSMDHGGEELPFSEPHEKYVNLGDDSSSTPSDPINDETHFFDFSDHISEIDDAQIDELISDFSDASSNESEFSSSYDSDSEEHAVDEPFRAPDDSDEEFQSLLETPEKSQEIPHRKHSRKKAIPRKRRPGKHKGDGLFGIPHLLVTAVWVVIILAVGSTLGKLLWVAAADVLAFGRESKDVTVSILDTDDIDSIAEKLHDVGLVNYPELFKLYAKITGSEDEIITGTFELNTVLDYHALSNALSPSSSNRTVVAVMIPEGYSCRQVFELLEDNHVCSVSSLEKYAAEGQFADFWFLENVERGDKYCLEGFLFPDTYEFYVNSTPREALGKMLTGFDNRFSSEMREQIVSLNEYFSDLMRKNGCSEEYIAENQLTVRELVIVASMIEEETAGTSESATIASVIYNRLAGKEVYERYLNIDASVYYALDGNIDPETGKVKALTAEDLKVNSPFNTYTNAGLTPTPISNPGLNSLQAALDPESTEYFYYVLNPETRLHQFSKTYEEHQQWVEKFKTSEDSQ